jgi:hypothetical protein
MPLARTHGQPVGAHSYSKRRSTALLMRDPGIMNFLSAPRPYSMWAAAAAVAEKESLA